MCIGIMYKGTQSYFLNADACLPIIHPRTGIIEWLPWGMRPAERHVHFFNGSTVTDHELREGKWAELQPIPVRIAAQRFAMLDRDRDIHWMPVPEGKEIRGVLARWRDEVRVYILISRESYSGHSYEWKRWPVFRPATRIRPTPSALQSSQASANKLEHLRDQAGRDHHLPSRR